jgi:hypothetical protein
MSVMECQIIMKIMASANEKRENNVNNVINNVKISIIINENNGSKISASIMSSIMKYQ